MENVTDSMTQFIRRNGYPGLSNPAIGTVFQSQTCVLVRWGWFALPAVLVALTVVFFVALIIQTKEIDHDYKTGVLPLLFHGLDKYSEKSCAQGLSRRAVIKKNAGQMHVRFKPTPRGWMFVDENTR